MHHRARLVGVLPCGFHFRTFRSSLSSSSVPWLSTLHHLFFIFSTSSSSFLLFAALLSVFICLSLYSLNNEWSKKKNIWAKRWRPWPGVYFLSRRGRRDGLESRICRQRKGIINDWNKKKRWKRKKIKLDLEQKIKRWNRSRINTGQVQAQTSTCCYLECSAVVWKPRRVIICLMNCKLPHVYWIVSRK